MQQVTILDFNLFAETLKSASKLVDAAKITIGPAGLSIYGATDRIARCEIESNAVTAAEAVSFSISPLGLFVKTLQTVIDIHSGDYTGFTMAVDPSQVRFSSKKFKTKLQCTSEDVIQQWVSKKVETQMTPTFEVVTNSDLIRRIGNHSYIFNNSEELRLYLETKPDMENNTLFATIGNRQNNLNNEMTLKLGMVTFGSLNGQCIIIDLKRLQLFNAVQSNDIKLQLTDKNVLVSRVKMTGKNDSVCTVTVYSSGLKS